MENASKALIIAGAILLAILLIGLGVYIYNQASHTVSDTNLDQLEVARFNEQFQPYFSNKLMSASTAKSLIQTIESSNSTSDPQVSCNGAKVSDIKKAHIYEALVTYDGALIKEILIKDINDDIIIGSGNSGETEKPDIVLSRQYVNGFFTDFLRGENLKGGEVERLIIEVENCNKSITTYQDTVIFDVSTVKYTGPLDPDDSKNYSIEDIKDRHGYIVELIVEEVKE